MAFGLIRARNLSAGEISSTDKHNSRRYSSAEEYPDNIDQEKRHDSFINVDYISNNGSTYLGKNESSLKESIDKRLKDKNVKGIRKNSNLAIEYVVGINDKKAWDNYAFDGFVANTKQWLEERHGENSVVAVFKHLDESNPHAHIIVVPVQEKIVKWKNTKGEGEKKEARLNTRDYTGGRDKLRELQNDYFEHLTKRYNGGEKLGLKLYRGTLVENQTKEYIEKTNHEIGNLKAELEVQKNNIEKSGEIFKQIQIKNQELIEKEILLKREQDRRNSENKNLWKLKGTKDNKDIFHTKKEDEKSPKKSKGLRR